jgi:predicted MFS family arabinose efflux permease
LSERIPPPPQASTPRASTSIWHTLRIPAFRGLFTGGALYFVGNAMQIMAAAWTMLQLTGSSFLAALVQTAVFLPMFLFSLPAGVLADITDRQRLITRALIIQAVSGSVLVALLFADKAGPISILFLVFVVGCCTAFLSPAWNSSITDTVSRDDLTPALTTIAIAYNAARAVGPALAGFVFAHANGAWNFVVAVVTALAMLHAVRRWPPAPHPATRLPAERLWGGMVSALRFARHSAPVLAQLVRTMAYSAAGSALWALLPVVGQSHLGLGATGYGLLMGCMGTGAVLAGLVIQRLRRRLGLELLVTLGCLVFATAMLIAAFSRMAPLVYAALLFAGGAWMAVMSTFNVATQSSVPPWVRARALAMHTISALGSFALGSAIWGAVSDLAGLAMALSLASAFMLAGTLLRKPFPLRMGERSDVTQAAPWDDLFIAHEPAPEDGPVAVEMSYRIREDAAQDFLEAIEQMRAPRRRDGATIWRVYRDLSDPSRYVERFIVTSWADYLHQRARATLADHELESQVRQYLLPGETVSAHHYLAER